MVVPQPRWQLQRLGDQHRLAAVIETAAALARGYDEAVRHRTHPGAVGQWCVELQRAAVQVPDEEAVAPWRGQCHQPQVVVNGDAGGVMGHRL